MKLKKIHINGIRIIGSFGLAVIILVLLTVPNVGNVDVLESVGSIVPDSPEDIVNQAISQNSIVDTSEIFTESNDSILQQFLDSQKIDSPLSTEKFGIEIQTALIDSFGNKSLNSTLFGVSQLSVTDEQGRLLDLGSIQTSFLGITRNTEKSTNIWGTVKFYLDDDLIATKKIWASSVNQQKTPLSVVSSLSFVESNVDNARISTIENQITSLRNEIISLGEQSCVNCNGRDTEIRIRDDKIDLLNAELTTLKSKVDAQLPSSPSFSDRKTNFTFTLSDEGRNWTDKSVHYYRVVLTDVNASIDSDNDFKKFSWNGEYIAYELKVTVDGSKVVKLDVTTDQVVNIFKSDGTMSVLNSICCTIDAGASSHRLPVSFELFVKSTGVSLGKIDNTSLISGTYGATVCGGYPRQVCSAPVASQARWNNPILSNIPRGTDLLLKSSDGGIFEFKTSESQKNYYIICEPSCRSNFGYST